MMAIRIIQLSVFTAICLLVFSQDSSIEKMAQIVTAAGPQSPHQSELPGDALSMLTDMKEAQR